VMEVIVSADAQATLQERLLSAPVDERQADLSLPAISSGGPAYPSSLCVQFRTLMRRNARLVVREPTLARARLGSAMVMSVIMGVLYFDMGTSEKEIPERIALVLFSLLFLSLSSLLPTVIAVLPEMAVVKKEIRNHWYNVKPYYAAKLLADTPLLVLPPLLFLTIMGSLSNFYNGEAWRFGALYLVLFAVVLTMHSMGICITVVAPDFGTAIFLVPISMLPQFIFAGFFVNVEDITWVFRWLSYVSVFRYAWEAVCLATFLELPLQIPSPVPGTNLTGNDVLQGRLGLQDAGMGLYWMDVAIVIAFGIFFRVVGFLALKRRVKK